MRASSACFPWQRMKPSPKIQNDTTCKTAAHGSGGTRKAETVVKDPLTLQKTEERILCSTNEGNSRDTFTDGTFFCRRPFHGAEKTRQQFTHLWC